MIAVARNRSLAALGGAIAVAWVLALAAELSGRAATLHHDVLIDGGVPVAAAVALFAAVWQVHIAAMMLPSSLPMVALFNRAAATQDRPGAARSAFLGGYALVWTGFGAIAFLGDVAVHRAVHAWAWLGSNEQVVAGGVLLLAGAFQFTDLKERCLRECRTPGGFLTARYRRGVAAAFRIGVEHGAFCLGCCWALMLLMFAVGVANLGWMAPLTALMVYEKIGRFGERVVRPVGVALIVLGSGTVIAASVIGT